jgi:chromosome segregation ATPase
MRKLIVLLAVISILTSNYTFAQDTESPEPTRPPRPTREVNRELRPSKEARQNDEDEISRPPKPTRDDSESEKGKERSCEVLKENLKRQADNTESRVEKFYDQVESIQKRVEDYYTSKLIPAGKTLPNHDTLIKDIQDKKAKVAKAVEAMQKAVDEVACDIQNPGQSRKAIKEDIKAVVEALQDYKRSLRNFIVAVHKLSSGEETVPTEAAKPTKLPSGSITPPAVTPTVTVTSVPSPTQ